MFFVELPGRFYELPGRFYELRGRFYELRGRFYGVVTERSSGFLQSKSYLRMLKTEYCFMSDSSSKYCRQN